MKNKLKIKLLKKGDLGRKHYINYQLGIISL